MGAAKQHSQTQVLSFLAREFEARLELFILSERHLDQGRKETFPPQAGLNEVESKAASKYLPQTAVPEQVGELKKKL